MTVLDRVVLGIVAVWLLLSAVVLALTAWGNPILASFFLSLGKTPIDASIVTLILVLLGIYVVFLFSKTEVDNRSIVHSSDLGDIRISLHSIQGLILKTTNQIQGIQDVQVQLTEGEPLGVRIDVNLLPDHHIPQLMETVQSQIRDYLQDTVGITVPKIEIFVKGISTEGKSRVG